MGISFASLRSHLAAIMEVDPMLLQSSTLFEEFEEWDSFARLSVVALVVEHTGKQLNIHDIEKLVSINDLLAHFQDVNRVAR